VDAEDANPAPGSSPQGRVSLEGRTLEGRYRVGAALGSGGMGTVHAAEDVRLGRPVVVKVPHPRLLAEPGFSERFRHEIERLIELPHPHVVRVFDVGEADGLPYAVLEHLGGGSLKDLLATRGGRLSAEEVTSWLPDVARALDFVHEQGVVHRDVKPGNVLFDGRGNVFLADFGIAKALGPADPGLTATGFTPGSPAYMGPEVALGVPIGPAYDQYALATMVYEALAGRPPYDGGPPEALVARKAYAPAADLGTLAPHVPAVARAAVMRALARAPAERFPTCRAFATAFAAGLRAEDGPAEDATARVVAGKPAPEAARGRPGRRGVVVGAGVALALGAAGLALALRGDRDPPDDPVTAGKASPMPGAAESPRVSEPPAPVEALPSRGAAVEEPPRTEGPKPGEGAAREEDTGRALFSEALELAESRAAAGDLEGAARAWSRAREGGAPGHAASTALREALARWEADPVLVLVEPVEGAVVDGRVRVSGELKEGRPTDVVEVNGAAVRTGPGPFATALAPAEGSDGAVRAAVRRGEALLAAVERRVVLERSPWPEEARRFLSGWAEAVGEGADPATRFPSRIRRTRDGMEMVLVAGGAFEMGAPAGADAPADARPRRTVTLSRPYYLDVHEVTVGMWAVGADEGVVRRPPRMRSPATDRHPVHNVTWEEAAAYASWAGVALPTEAQWERAAKGGDDARVYPWGASDDVGARNGEEIAQEDGFGGPAPVASYRPNRYGLHDMAGNVAEWCADWYDERFYATGPSVDPVGPRAAPSRSVRGGSFESASAQLRVFVRSDGAPDARVTSIGLRCAKPLP
jgi:formylglycine-generating enzyme required for sulfatase activity